jgi:phospholipid/cholesterol/gamma-HCH transport system substrate-binding protein
MEARSMTQSKREHAMVGFFVLVAAALLVYTVFALGGISSRNAKTFHAYFPFAGGVDSGTEVRYAGGPKIGRVEKVGIDPRDSSRIEVTFSVDADLPVKTDSLVKIMSMTPLGDNHVEILPGSDHAGLAAPGAQLPSEPYISISSLMEKIQDIAPDAQQLLKTFNERGTELKETLNRVNDLLNARNRSNISAVIADSRGMIQENRPQLKSTLEHLNDVSAKLQPVLDDLRKTAAKTNDTIDHVDALIGEDRPDIHQAILDLRHVLATVTTLTGRLDQTLDVNSENIDQVLENLREVTENLKEFTNTIKTHPNLLIRSSNPPEHKPGGRQ